MNTLIVADVHLKVSESGAETRREFAQFLRSVDSTKVERLILLGDLFDFWFEYRHVVFSGYFDILRALAELRDQGIDLHLIVGNHDFWGGRFLEDEIGFTIHQKDYRCAFDGKQALLVHGDGINPEDYRYRLYKKIARSGLAIGMFRLLHPDWAMKLAQGVSHGSRTLLKPKNAAESAEVKALRSFAERTLNAGDADIVICGHTHYPEEIEFETPNGSGLYINTGDWMEKRTYLEWDGQKFNRKTYRPE